MKANSLLLPIAIALLIAPAPHIAWAKIKPIPNEELFKSPKAVKSFTFSEKEDLSFIGISPDSKKLKTSMEGILPQKMEEPKAMIKPKTIIKIEAENEPVKKQ